MGGFGSTRWRQHTKKWTTDDCQTISVFDLRRQNLLTPSQMWGGSWYWRDACSGRERGSINFELNLQIVPAYIQLHYFQVTENGERKMLRYPVRMQKSACHYGGERWWFICPSLANGRCGGRRVAKLYLAPSSSYFACRHCHNLTYRSSQESDKSIAILKQMETAALWEAMKCGDVDFNKGLKALPTNLLGKS